MTVVINQLTEVTPGTGYWMKHLGKEPIIR